MTVLSMADELAAHRFFRLIPSELRVRLAGCAKNVVFAAGDRICVEGTHASGFFALRSGRVNVGIYVPHQGLQVLEGQADAVEQCFERISADTRHGAVTRIHSGPIAAPSFSAASA